MGNEIIDHCGIHHIGGISSHIQIFFMNTKSNWHRLKCQKSSQIAHGRVKDFNISIAPTSHKNDSIFGMNSNTSWFINSMIESFTFSIQQINGENLVQLQRCHIHLLFIWGDRQKATFAFRVRDVVSSSNSHPFYNTVALLRFCFNIDDDDFSATCRQATSIDIKTYEAKVAFITDMSQTTVFEPCTR